MFPQEFELGETTKPSVHSFSTGSPRDYAFVYEPACIDRLVWTAVERRILPTMKQGFKGDK